MPVSAIAGMFRKVMNKAAVIKMRGITVSFLVSAGTKFLIFLLKSDWLLAHFISYYEY